MCGFVGFSNLKEKVIQDKSVIETMNQTLCKRGPDEDGYYIEEHIEDVDKYLPVVKELLNKMNAILEKIPATEEEILNGFK